MTMARAYAVFANGGFLVDPYFVDRIVDRDGKEIYKAQPVVACRHCQQRLLEDTRVAQSEGRGDGAAVRASLSPISSAQAASAPASVDLEAPRLAPRALDARTNYLISSLLHDVIRRGTGAGAMVLKRNDLAGKTGSTNDHRDGWFSGYNEDIVASAWVGFDDFTSLGYKEFGAETALPMWISFMRTALKGVPEKPFEMPPGVSTARIDPETGALATADDTHSILEYFKSEDIARLATGPTEQTEQEKKVQQDAYGIF
jgi:penicillin-binding protein 1A